MKIDRKSLKEIPNAEDQKNQVSNDFEACAKNDHRHINDIGIYRCISVDIFLSITS